MPALITHDTFGQDIYKKHYTRIGESRDEFEAFLLGNQGPDPLFYSIIVPHLYSFHEFASTMHQKKPSELLVALKQSLSVLEDNELPIGYAYALGFLCHYVLDSSIHPLVYFYEYQLSGAGVEGLGPQDEKELHATIESELDELVLFTQRGETVATFNPSIEILKGSDFVLGIISKMYTYLALVAYGTLLPKNMYTSSLKSHRRTESVFSSSSGAKRFVLGKMEELIRPYSFIRAMSPRAIELTESQFDNHEKARWENPFTGKVTQESFWDLYHQASDDMSNIFTFFDNDHFDLETAQSITRDLNFSGEPTVAILEVEVNEPTQGTLEES